MQFDELVARVARALTDARIPYVVVGGVAVTVYGRIRSTLDVDVILDLQPEAVPGFVLAMKGAGLDVTAADVLDALRERSHFTVFVPDSQYRIDCKGAYSENERASLRGRTRRKLGETWVALDSVENLIAHKLLFGAEHDLADAEAVYVRQKGDVDAQRLRERAAAVGVLEELDALLRRVDAADKA